MTKARGVESRRDFPRDPAAVLRLCRAFWSELGKVQAQVTIQGPVYQAISRINGRIDDLAQWLTGEESYFNRGIGCSTARPEVLKRWERWAAIERGDEPWPDR
jgi:hypothetical protein